MSKVLVNFIQDRSGSMQSVWAETLSGFKAFVAKLRDDAKAEGVEYLFSLTTFDTLVETPIVAQPIANVDGEVLAKNGPRGSTALYDAVGMTLENTASDLHGAEKVIVVVVTDGQENSSREWNKDRLHTAIDAKLNAGNWTFTYLGTQPETWDDAGALGLSVGATRGWDPKMAHAAYSAVACSVSRLASSPRRGTRNFMDDFMSEEEMAAAGLRKQAEPQPKPTPKASHPTGRWR